MTQSEIGPLLKMLSNRLKASADASLKKSNVTLAQTQVMKFVHQRGGRTTQNEIEEYLDVAHPTAVGIISRLEKNGFLNCYFDSGNRNRKIVCITKKAEALREFLYSEMRRAEEILTKGLSEAELSELSRMLRILYRNLE